MYTAATRGELAVRACECGSISHLPVARCGRCGSTVGEWRAVSGRGRVLSWTAVAHQVHPAFPTPHTIVLVALEDHPEVHLLGYLAGAPAITADQPAEVWFEELDEGVVIPQWRLIERTGDGAAGTVGLAPGEPRP